MSTITQPWTEPGRGSGLLDVVRRRYLLKLLVRKELRVRYRGSVLGLAWSYVKPAVQYVVYFLALGIFLNLRGAIEDYPVYLFSGLVVVNVFSEAFSNATRAVVWNAPLVKKIFLPRELFPVASVWVAGVHFVPQLVVLYQWRQVAEVAPGWITTLYQVNPITVAVELYHYAFWWPGTARDASQLPPDLLLHTVIAVVIAAVVLAVGQLVFRRVEGRFAQDL